jgi:CheY-like chemotaxis protein
VRPGHGTILVVDDEKQLLKCTARLLRTMGYEVLTASDGRTAIELVRQCRDNLSLVVLDMTMPEMSGADTFAGIREIAPAMKVLLSSGYTVDGQAQKLLDRGCNGFIQKPFDATALCEKIEEIRQSKP